MKKIMSFPLLLLSLHSCRRPFFLSISHPCRARSHLWLYTSSFPHTCAERVSSLHLIFHKTAVPHTRFLSPAYLHLPIGQPIVLPNALFSFTASALPESLLYNNCLVYCQGPPRPSTKAPHGKQLCLLYCS